MIPTDTPLPIVPNPPPTLAARAVDTLNPLHHIPFIGFLYRNFTDDAITPDARFAGGMLYGGPLGALGAVASMIIGGAIDSVSTTTAFGEDHSANTPRIRIIDPWQFNE